MRIGIAFALGLAWIAGGGAAFGQCEPQEETRLVPFDATHYQGVGASLAIDGGTALVGAGGAVDSPRSVYVFERVGGVWTQTAKLTTPDWGPQDYFGDSVSASGETLLVSAIRDDDRGNNCGAAYVFEKVGGEWVQTAKLTGDDGEAYDNFGDEVSLHGDRALIGAWQDDDHGTDSGSAYVFERAGGVWTQTAKLTASDGAAGDYFGWAVSIRGGVAVVGALRNDDHGEGSGSAYVFELAGGSWGQAAKLDPAGNAAADQFGGRVALDGVSALIGASGDDDNGPESGSAFLYALNCACPADFNGDGVVDTRDFVTYLNAWAAGEAGADIDGNGVVDTRDFIMYLNLWATGC